jgi:hypothetical protein
MVEYKCDKCEKTFDKKSHYDYHINRKNPCDKVEPICEYCDKKFSRKDNLKTHMNKCKLKNINKISTNINNNKLNNSSINNTNNKIDVNNGTNNGTINNTIVNNPIIIFPFLGEDMSKLTEKQKINILKKCYMSIPELIKQINFNPNIPENHNVYISNIKSKFGHINDGKKWILTKVDQLIDDLINKKKDDIEELLDEYEEQLPDKVVDKIRDVIASIDYDPLSDEEPSKSSKEKNKFKKQIMDEVKLLLYNNKEIPQATRAKQEKNNDSKINK